MKDAKLKFRNILALGVSLFLAAGCITTQQVSEIVVSSNAAMISPGLNVPGSESLGAWEEPVAQIDQLILQNEDQPTLVNHLRVRQAMLLTVNKQNNLAAERWKQVNSTALKTERDKTLYQNRNALVWWYVRAPDMESLDPAEQDDVRSYVSQLDQSLNNIKDPDLKFYLGTVRAQMNYRVLNDADVATDVLQTQTSEKIAGALDNYFQLFSDEDKTWLRSGSTVDLADASGIADFRRLTVFRDMVGRFCKLPARLELQGHQWSPEYQNICRNE